MTGVIDMWTDFVVLWKHSLQVPCSLVLINLRKRCAPDSYARLCTRHGCSLRWVLSEVSYKHEPTPTASSSTANANLKMSNLDVSRHDLTRRSELNLGLHGSGFDSSDSLTAAFTSGECLRRMSSASALHKAGFQEDKDGDEGEFDPEVGDTGMQDGWVISPVLDAGTADIAGSAVKQQPWFPLGPSSSTSDTGRGWWKGGGGDDKGKAASRLAVSETDDSGVSEDYDDGDEDGNKSSSSHGGCLFFFPAMLFCLLA